MEALRRRSMLNALFEEKDYLAFTAVGDGTFTFTGTTVDNVTNSLSYSLDGGITWVALASGVASPTVQAGDTIYWKGKDLSINNSPNGGIGNFSSTNIFDVSGNPMSLYYGSNFKRITSIPAYIFVNLFKSCDKLKNAVNLSLPATTLAPYCYGYMFYGCTSLTTTPVLPATTLADHCYFAMFYNCKNLTTAPILPATTLADYCYLSMFLKCSGLTTAPELPATTLAPYCYQQMFELCTSLTTAPELPATTLATYCYSNMFNSCIRFTTTPELPATTLAPYCYSNMFSSCSGLTTAHVLPATTLVNYCYFAMFYNCANLTTAPELPATTLATYCYDGMFLKCRGLTTAPILPATTLVSHCYDNMFKDCNKLNYIKAMFITTPSGAYTASWVSSTAASGTFVKNSAATWNVTGNNGIPSRWTVLTSSS